MILPMVEVRLLGPRDLLADALAFLQGAGVLQLRAPSEDGPDGYVRCCAPTEEAGARARRLEDVIARAGALAARLPAPARDGAPERLPPADAPAFLERLAVLSAEVDALVARRASLREEARGADRFARLVAALAPLDHRLDPALQPEMHLIVVRPDAEALGLLEAEVRRITGGACEVHARPLAGGETAVRVTVPRAHGRAVTALLFERGVEEVKLPARYAGETPAAILLRLAARIRELPAERAAIEDALTALSARIGPALAATAAEARAALARLRAAERCGETRFAFVVSGWMPAERLPDLRRDAARRWGERVVIFAAPPRPGQWGDVPVVLRNRRLIRPFQLLLGLVPLPRYGSLDPTPWVAFGFPLLFGFVLGDVVFGALGIAVAAIALRRGWGGATGRDVSVIALACSASALVFGVLFGEALGELGAPVGLTPILLHRREAVMPFLALALGVGGAHVVVGTALGVLTAVRGGHRRHAVARAAKLALLLAAAAWIAARSGVLPASGGVPAAAIGAVALAVAVATEGPLALLEVVLGVGNVLSYARLMALGLASVMLAEVANTVARTLEPVAAGVAIAVLLHAVNFSLGLISPTVAALRLHYVEFFEKFYDEGGVPYRPFALA